jgi:hypothetical protein
MTVELIGSSFLLQTLLLVTSVIRHAFNAQEPPPPSAWIVTLVVLRRNFKMTASVWQHAIALFTKTTSLSAQLSPQLTFASLVIPTAQLAQEEPLTIA